MPRYRRARRTMTDIGPYFSTDAGGRPAGRMHSFGGLGQIPGLPPLGLPTGLGVDINQLLQGVPQMSALTPWAEQTSDFQWAEIRQPPEFNVAAYDYGGVLTSMLTLGMGPPGFVAVLTRNPLKLSAAEALYAGTAYKLFSGQAVYKQEDPGEPPQMAFLYWGALRDAGDGAGGGGDVQTAAASVGGVLIWGIELSSSQSSQRGPPSTPFANAYAVQFGGPLPQTTPPNGMTPIPSDQPPPNGGQPATTTPSTQKASMGGPVAVGFGVALVTYLIVRGMK